MSLCLLSQVWQNVCLSFLQKLAELLVEHFSHRFQLITCSASRYRIWHFFQKLWFLTDMYLSKLQLLSWKYYICWVCLLCTIQSSHTYWESKSIGNKSRKQLKSNVAGLDQHSVFIPLFQNCHSSTSSSRKKVGTSSLKAQSRTTVSHLIGQNHAAVGRGTRVRTGYFLHSV